MRLLRRQSRGV